MTVFDLQQVPENVSVNKLEENVARLAKLHTFSDKERVLLTYLGGITNHGLKAEGENVFVRIPGTNSSHFVDRVEELQILHQISELGLYPKLLEAYSEGELSGYKVEPFIEGETLQFIDFAKHQFEVLPVIKELHDSSAVFNRTYDIFARLHVMCDALGTEKKVAHMPVSEVKQYINNLQKIKQDLFSYPIALAPCHNDITPVNFIKLKAPINGRKYQLIDWEYAGMNDRMYDIAGIAAMLAMSLNEPACLVLRYFNSTNTEKYAEEIKRVQFYMPVVKLYYAIWSALQVETGNESTSIDELKSGWGPESLTIFLDQYHSEPYQALIHAHAV